MVLMPTYSVTIHTLVDISCYYNACRGDRPRSPL